MQALPKLRDFHMSVLEIIFQSVNEYILENKLWLV